MTLFRQIVLMTLLLFTLLLVVVLSMQFSHTRAYLAKQLHSDVQNTVTSLGLSLVPHLEAGDRAAVESVVNVVFDGGYYQQIRVQKTEGELLANREADTRVDAVPQWFTDLALFEPVSEENVLTSGWMQLATLKVSGHPGYAYQQLWQQVSGLLMWFVGAFILVIAILVYGLRYLLWPLGQLQQRARSIERQQFGEPLPEPRIRELRGLVNAFNSMSNRLHQLFEAQAMEAERLRQTAYTDDSTGVANRPFFTLQLNRWLSDPGEGGIALIGTPGLSDLESKHGYQAREAVMQAKAKIVQAWIKTLPGALVARLAKKDLVVILPGLDAEQVEKGIVALIERLSETFAQMEQGASLRCAVGVVIRRPEHSATELLSQADMALQQARSNHQGLVIIPPETNQPTLGREQWRKLVTEALAQRRFYFLRQPVMAYPSGQVENFEIYTGLEVGQRYHAAQFMPFIDQFQLGADVDRAILDTLKPGLASAEAPLTVNLSESAIADRGFSLWLEGYLHELGPARRLLSFDLPEEALIRSREALIGLCHLLTENEVHFGFDRTGLHLERLKELTKLNPAYVKIDSDLVMGDENEHFSFLKAVVTMVHTQGIKVILTRLESTERLLAFEDEAIDGYQGFIAPPEEWNLP